jgi:hypothetical protein
VEGGGGGAVKIRKTISGEEKFMDKHSGGLHCTLASYIYIYFFKAQETVLIRQMSVTENVISTNYSRIPFIDPIFSTWRLQHLS